MTRQDVHQQTWSFAPINSSSPSTPPRSRATVETAPFNPIFSFTPPPSTSAKPPSSTLPPSSTAQLSPCPNQAPIFIPVSSRIPSPAAAISRAASPFIDNFNALSLLPSRSDTPSSTGAPVDSTPATPASSPPPRGRPHTGTTSPTPTPRHRANGRTQSPTETEAIATSTVTTPPHKPYDPAEEVASDHKFFSVEFQGKLDAGKRLAKDLSECLERVIDDISRGASSTDADVKELGWFLSEAQRLQDFRPSETRTVAVLGDSGEGKSSLINSLLHCPGIAETSDIGSACTSVVTEYRYKQSNQTSSSPIAIEVEYLSTTEIATLIRELVWSYRQFYLPEVESDATTAQDYARYERESAQAWSALESAFGHEDEFNRNLLKGSLSTGTAISPSASGDADDDNAVQRENDRIAERLIRWAGNIEWPHGAEAGMWTAAAQNVRECREKTELFMENRVWPFTKIIRIYLDAHVLKTGIVLADLPGLQDTNLARVRATQDYLIRCDHIFVVAKISRAITDSSLRSSLYHAISKHAPMEWESSAGKLKVAVVCTKSDDINTKTAIEKFCGPGKRFSLEQMHEFDRKIREATAANDLRAEKSARALRQLLLMTARNEHVKRGLRNAYAAEIPGGDLPVFCVSNKLYDAHASKSGSGDPRSVAKRSIEGSQIPHLRQFCRNITADAQLSEAQNFLESQIPKLMGSVDVFAASYAARIDSQRRTLVDDTEARQRLNNAFRFAMEEAAHLRRKTDETFQQNIFDFLAHRGDNWESAAVAEGAKWTVWHWTQYSAWCKRNGNHSTEKRGHVDWNAKIMWKMRSELEFAWDIVEDDIPERFNNLVKRVKEEISDFGFAVYPLVTEALATSIKASVISSTRDLEYKLDLEQQQLSRELKCIRRCLLDSHASSFVVQEMAPSYRSASCQTGTGMFGRQKSIVQGHLESKVVFPNIILSLSGTVKDLLDKTEELLRKVMDDGLNDVACDMRVGLDTMTRQGSAVVESVEVMQRKKRLLEFLQPRLASFKGRQVEIVAGLAA